MRPLQSHQVHALAMAFTLAMAVFAIFSPGDVKVFTAILSVTAAAMTLFAIFILWRLDLAPDASADLAALKSSLADYAGFMTSVVLLLLLVITGKIP